jgi:ParB-like chromosome segregation protein Spo0J
VNAFVRPSRSAWLTFAEIEVSGNARPYSATEVVALANSIRQIGLLTPLTVVERNERYLLIAGRHRLEALRLVEADRIPVRIVDFNDIEARLWTISENLHRAELTATQRAEQIAEWIRITEEKRRLAQVEPAVLSDGRKAPPQNRPSGLNAAVLELKMERNEAQRAVKIASITPEAKEAAREAGLDDNQSALLKIAAAPAEAQVKAVDRIVQAARPIERAEVASSPTAKPLRNLENLSGGALARWIKITTPNDRPHVIRVLETAASLLREELEGRDVA